MKIRIVPAGSLTQKNLTAVYHFKVAPVEVTDDDGERVGSLGGRFDGVYEILLPGDRSWIITPQEIWAAVVAADAEFSDGGDGPR